MTDPSAPSARGPKPGRPGEPSSQTGRSTARSAESIAPPPDVRGRIAGRFTLGRCLGAGTFGVVFEAREDGRGTPVALKRLSQADAAAIYDFKQEFRALAGVSHPNLVGLYELFSDEGELYLSMELVEGVGFLDWVRRGAETITASGATVAVGDTDEIGSTRRAFGEGAVPSVPGAPPPPHSGKLDEERLRACLPQLAAGVAAIHAAGKLHRDLKPSNVMVAYDGRVKILDFGLVASQPGRDSRRNPDRRIVGTPGYMSPEQAQGAQLAPASDWYSLGVILYEALTGSLPIGGDVGEILSSKLTLDPPDPRLLAPDLPHDLADLAVALLERKSGDRPMGEAVLRVLGATPPEIRAGGEPWSESLPFVGRDHHLAVLEEAFAATREHKPVTLHVHGASGMGKTALLARFLDELADREGAVILDGRCYERESVPYKAVDSLIDALTQHLRGLPDAEVERLLPPDVQTLARVFPVLSRVEAVRDAPRRAEAPEPQEQRRQAFGALRELLARMAAERPLVACIDDLQWGDADSAALLLDLLEPGDFHAGAAAPHPSGPPSLLLIVSYRSEHAASIELSRVARERLARGEIGSDVRELVVGPLAHREARALARALLAGEADAGVAEQIAVESQGNPLFVHELARYVRAAARGRGALVSPPRAISLQQVLTERVARLPDEARRLLETIAVEGRPIAQEPACRAAGLDPGTPALALLRAEHLVRSSSARHDGPESASRPHVRTEIETFHDRIREVVVAALSPGDRAARHLHLADALEAAGEDDPEALLAHLRAAGRGARALRYVEIAADRAASALAFDRAAALYREALDLRADSPQALRKKLADALADAGRGGEAARAYVAAVEGAPDAEALELRRRAAEQFLRSGHIDEGLAAIGDVLAAVDLELPRTPSRALASLVYRRTRLAVRGLGFTERAEAEVDPRDLARIDVCWSVGSGLGAVDIVRAADFQSRHLLEALRAGEPYRIARGLAFEAILSAMEGKKRGRARAIELAGEAEVIARRIQHPHAVAWAESARMASAYYDYRFRDTVLHGDRAAALFRETCRDFTWEVGSIEIWFVLGGLYYQGEMEELARRLPQCLREAEEVGSLYNETTIRTAWTPRVHLLADRPAEARRESATALARWTQHGYHTLHTSDLFVRALAWLYEGDGAQALAEVQGEWPALEKSLLLRVELVRVEMLNFRGQAAVLAARQGHGDFDKLLRGAERDARALEGEKQNYPDALASLLRAAIAAARGRPDKALALYGAAAKGFEDLGMQLHAAAARAREGEILGGEEGRHLVREAMAWMSGRRARSPERMARMLAPA